MKELIPDILQHLGPKQLESLKELIKPSKKSEDIKEQPEEEDEEIPNLVNQNFEDKAKEETK